MDELSRFKLVPGTRRDVLVLPACSLFNRRDDEEWYIDTDYDVDDGRVYIGKSDFEVLAQVAGYVSLDSIKELVKQAEEAEYWWRQYVGLLSRLSNMRDSLVGVVDELTSVTDNEDDATDDRDLVDSDGERSRRDEGDGSELLGSDAFEEFDGDEDPFR